MIESGFDKANNTGGMGLVSIFGISLIMFIIFGFFVSLMGNPIVSMGLYLFGIMIGAASIHAFGVLLTDKKDPAILIAVSGVIFLSLYNVYWMPWYLGYEH
jgi:hypothetical protein